MAETWKEVPLEGHEGISVSTLGRVRGRSGKVLAVRKDKLGYLRVGIYLGKNQIKNELVHRLVAITFVPNPEGKPHVNHIDNNRHNPAVTNLEWCTITENVAHRVATGSGRCSNVAIIGTHTKTGEVVHFSSIKEAAAFASIDRSCISRCLTGSRRSSGGYDWRYANAKERPLEDLDVPPEYGERYRVTRSGRVFSLTQKQFMTVQTASGYAQLRLIDDTGKAHPVQVHRLIAATYLVRPNDPGATIVNHKDGNPLNNDPENLEWVTRSENARHAVETGLSPVRKRILARSTDPNDTLVEEYSSIRECAEALGVHESAVSGAVSGRQATCKGFVLAFA